MKGETLSNSNISVNNKKLKNEKTYSTEIDSNSQKYDSCSNKNSENIPENKQLIVSKNYEISLTSEKNYIFLPINELRQFKAWNSSNLNAIYQNILTN